LPTPRSSSPTVGLDSAASPRDEGNGSSGERPSLRVSDANAIRIGTPRALDGDRPGVAASVQVGDEVHEIWYRVSRGPVALSADAFVAAILPCAMKLGQRIAVPSEVSPQLLESIPTIQTILRSWLPDCRETGVDARLRPPSAPDRGRGAGSFFSGGVDSFYTALKHRGEVATLILVHGFDVRLEDLPLRASVSAAMKNAAAELGIPLIEVETNVRSFADRYFPWEFYHGAMLASVAMVLSRQLHTVYVPASDSYATLTPWGSHPLLDPLWSTEQTRLVHDGLESNRLEKVVELASSRTALRYLRVCFPWNNEAASYNCGRCAKCLGTMACLRSAGALGRCATFPSSLNLRLLATLPPVDDAHRPMLREVLRSVELAGNDPLLAGALRSWFEGRHYRGVRGLPRRGVNKIRRMARDQLQRMLGVRI
jgi:hypothetical protein